MEWCHKEIMQSLTIPMFYVLHSITISSVLYFNQTITPFSNISVRINKYTIIETFVSMAAIS